MPPRQDLDQPHQRGTLTRAELDPDPLALFVRWLDEARQAGVELANAACLATAAPDGAPSARMVLLKGQGPDGLDFFTHYESRKATELEANPRAALCLYWKELRRQVRAEGPCRRLPPQASDAYFQSRPRGSRLSAWASPQSQPIADRPALEALRDAAARRFQGHDQFERPPFWGGYRLSPQRIEFWNERDDRYHDRFLYRLRDGHWQIERLAP